MALAERWATAAAAAMEIDAGFDDGSDTFDYDDSGAPPPDGGAEWSAPPLPVAVEGGQLRRRPQADGRYGATAAFGSGGSRAQRTASAPRKAAGPAAARQQPGLAVSRRQMAGSAPSALPPVPTGGEQRQCAAADATAAWSVGRPQSAVAPFDGPRRAVAPSDGPGATGVGRMVTAGAAWLVQQWGRARRWAAAMVDGARRRVALRPEGQPPRPARAELIAALRAAAADTPAPTGAGLVAPRAAAAQAMVRGTRDATTARGHRTAIGRVLAFVEANPELGGRSVGLSPELWDATMEGFVTAMVSPQVEGSPWARPAGWPADCSPQHAARQQKAAAAGLLRLGWLPEGTTLGRTAATRRALGCGDQEDVQRVDMIFPWEVFEGAEQGKEASPWHLAARALVVLAVIAGGRPGEATGLLVGHVSATSNDNVIVLRRKGFRLKPQHARATRRGRRSAPAIPLEHVAIGAFVQPWLQWLRDRGVPDSHMLFPSLVRDAYARARSSEGSRVGGGLWMEPCRPWSARQVIAALDYVLTDRRGRTMQGLRSGCNVELKRLGTAAAPGTTAVPDVVRRALQGRSLKPILGSEAAYFEAFADETREATRQLGSLRIVRRHGALRIDAVRSAATGKWSPTPAGERDRAASAPAAGSPRRRGARTFGEAGEGSAEPPSSSGYDSDSDSGSDDSDSGSDSASPSSSEGTDTSGGSDTESSEAPPHPASALDDGCARCRARIGLRDHGWQCDQPGCRWTVCMMCHRGGARAPLLCPKHKGGM